MMHYTLIFIILIWPIGLAMADVQVFMDAVKVPGIIKDTNRLATSTNATGAPGVPKKQYFGGVQDRDVDLVERQQCPPAFPFLCPNLRCCPATHPICCIGDRDCCPSTHPVCEDDDVCCPLGMVSCGDDDPLYCHEPGVQCCGDGIFCLDTEECCGNGCCPKTDNGKCCPGSSDDKASCCGQYEVCCDGWCCYEGSTCAADFGYCYVPQLVLGWQSGGLSADLVENVCLGIRGQIAMGRPETTPNSQIVEYAGPGSNNRESTDCKSSRRPRCCQDRFVPPGEPGAGDAMTCDEYPFNSVKEGGVGAHVACVDEHANGAGGDLLTSLLAGKHEGFKFQVAVVGIDCNTVTEADVHPCNPLA